MSYSSFKSRVAGSFPDSTASWPLVAALVLRAARCSASAGDLSALLAFKAATEAVVDVASAVTPNGTSLLVEWV
jgi:hypothetical protein